MTVSIIFLLMGFVLLIAGGELLVNGAVKLAERAGMSQMLIGLTIVGFGTSAPELVASLEAAFAGSPGIAWGNVVGSNLANSLLILGTAALIMPMAVERGPLWRDGGLAVVITALLYYCAYADLISIPMGIAFLCILIAYLIFAYVSETRLMNAGKAPTVGTLAEEHDKVQSTFEKGDNAVASKAAALEVTDTHLHDEEHWARSAAVLAAGIILIILGGRWLVSSAVDIAATIGMSEAVIGLTVIAIGTSLPELVTAVIAARKGASAVALGNILGSNLFNLLLIGGATATLAPAAIPVELLSFGLPALLLSSILLIIFAATNHIISRTEGAILLFLYCVQILYNLFAL